MNDRDELSRRLWLLREQMEQLVCALDIQQLVLGNNRLRWLPMVSENVEQIADDIAKTEVDRITLSRRVAASLGLEEDASLADLARVAGDPHHSLWRQSRLHLVALQTEIDDLSRENHALTRRGLAGATNVINTLNGQDDALDTYDPSGSAMRIDTASSRFDRSV